MVLTLLTHATVSNLHRRTVAAWSLIVTSECTCIARSPCYSYRRNRAASRVKLTQAIDVGDDLVLLPIKTSVNAFTIKDPPPPSRRFLTLFGVLYCTPGNGT